MSVKGTSEQVQTPRGAPQRAARVAVPQQARPAGENRLRLWLRTSQDEVARAADEIQAACRRSNEERVTSAPVGGAAVLAASAAPDLPPVEDEERALSVAILGRTKAGKSQLVAALTGDLAGLRVGRGRQRTTRISTSHEWTDFTVVDTPGVGALDGDADTERARTAAASADAVIWLYAESLQEEEAAELQDLLRTGVPVVVAFNAKWAVDDPERRELFAELPDLAFRDLSGHLERVRQIARRAGTRTPPFMPVHARAAWWSLKEPREARAWIFGQPVASTCCSRRATRSSRSGSRACAS